jgi:hypothetical protein
MLIPKLFIIKGRGFMETYNIPNAILKIGGAASILASILMMAGFVLHPAGEDAIFGTDPFWVPAHALLWLAFTVALPGWIGLYIVQASKAGRFGVAGFVVIIFGTSLVSWIFSSDVTFVPVIAAESPGLFQKIFSNSHIAMGIASVLTWVLGNVLFGASVIRAKIFPRWAGILLIIGSVVIPITYLAGVSVKVVAVGAIIAGAGQIWLGYELFRSLRGSTTPA